MNAECVWRFLCPNKPVCSTGRRATFYYPNGGTYAGYWKCNKNHLWGVKESATYNYQRLKNKKPTNGTLIYQGEWRDDNRHGVGSMIRHKGTDYSLIYAGHWENDKKFGEGKKIYEDGSVYFGYWKESRRHGLGIQWYKDGSIYVGQWEGDYHHGLGVMFYANGNRYEGHFARGYKNGEGIFYHNHTGQIQKGMWDYDNAKVSVMQDEMRNQGDKPTPYPIPKNKLQDPNSLMTALFQQYIFNGYKPQRPFSEKVCLEFNRKYRQFASFEERFGTPSKINIYNDDGYPCVCKRPEKHVTLCVIDEEVTPQWPC